MNQAQFAEAAGVSRDAIASWETGRNTIKASTARHIASLYGLNPECLISGSGKLVDSCGHEFDLAESERAEQLAISYLSQRRIENCLDTLELLLTAAKDTFHGPRRFSRAFKSFVRWSEHVATDLRLGSAINKLLAQRIQKTMSFREWRSRPDMHNIYGFRDDPKRRPDEQLTLRDLSLTKPIWQPGVCMRPMKKRRAERTDGDGPFPYSLANEDFNLRSIAQRERLLAKLRNTLPPSPA